MNREVWISEEAYISVWEEDASGNVLSPMVRELYFAQNASVKPVRRVMEYEEPGVAFRQQRSVVIGYEVKLSEFFQKKGNQWSPFMDASKRFRILVELINPMYTGITPLEQDTFDFRGCTPVDGPSIGLSDDAVAVWDIGFFAEELVSG